jgi:tetratricopeptide (TPR) repeat protein
MLTLTVGCAPAEPAKNPSTASLQELRRLGKDEPSARVSAAWLLAELLEPGGEPARARRARARLDATKQHGMYEDLARALDDSVHGRLAAAPASYLKAAKAARESTEPEAPLIAQFAIDQAMALSNNAQGLWGAWQAWVEASIKEPKALGWRARDALVHWWGDEAWESATRNVEQQIATAFGCVGDLRMAGPFGSGDTADALRSHAPEGLAPWPETWPTDPLNGQTPRVLKTEQKGCAVRVDDGVQEGVFYLEATFALKNASDAILSVGNALAVWVDGELVMDRDLREWGSWTRSGAGLRLDAGPHRVVARLTRSDSALRLLQRDGRPLASTKVDLERFSPLSQPTLAFEANELRRFVNANGVRPPDSPVLQYVTAHIANIDGESEAATLLLEPLVKKADTATGTSLAMAAEIVENDPIYGKTQTEDLIRELHRRALKHDPDLWASELARVGHLAKSKGVVDAVRELKKLAKRYQQVPALLGALASVYGELGWSPEYRRTIKEHAARFPDDVEALYAAARILEEDGQDEEARALFERIKRLDPDTEVLVGRAIEQQHYETAIAELDRLHQRRPNRKDLERRLEDLRVRAGKRVDRGKLLREAVKRAPKKGKPRLGLADANYAAGDKEALSAALVEAIEAGADAGPIKSALDLVHGVTELEPHRLDGQRVIREYEQAGEHLTGTAARVLDYMAVWVRNDGSSRYLEHEIIRVQSKEAIDRFAEHEVRGDLVLKMRVLKKDGRILEPEPVSGKPTVTFPHLEIGDYIETEQIFGSPGSPNGVTFDGPRWFFREKSVAYARSEFVLISPTDKPLDLETTGDVPKPSVEHNAHFTIRRWRVDKSPAAPEEPRSVPPEEYLPSVSASWGLDLERHLARLANRVEETVPVDPRIVRVAENIVGSIPRARELDRARALYRWVLDNVQMDDEDDGRRVVIGKRGNRWQAFTTLCRSLQIPVRWVVARNRLAPPPKGPASEAAQFANTVLLVGSSEKAWVVLADKYSPFGYIPVEVRGMEGYVLDTEGSRPVSLPAAGELDRIEFTGRVKLAADGQAKLELAQVFGGKFGAGVREALSELGERQIKDAVEGKILGANMRGARLLRHAFTKLDQLDSPLTLEMEAQMAHFALVQGGTLRLAPPYTPSLSQFTTLPSRQTPILISNELNWAVRLEITLPPNARVELPAPETFEFGAHKVEVRDQVTDNVLILHRTIRLSAGRITPDSYARFVEFARGADAALSREIQIR